MDKGGGNSMVIDKKQLTTRDRQAIERKQQLLNAARVLFAEKGFRGTSTKEINQSIGLADGLLYYYFPKGKKQVLDAIIEEAFQKKEQLADSLFNALEPTDPLREALFKIFSSAWNGVAEEANRLTIMIIIHEQPLLQKEQVTWVSYVFEHSIARLAHFFEAYVQSGELRPLNCTFMARHVMNLFQSTCFNHIFIARQSELDESTLRDVHANIDFLLECWR